MQKLSNKKLRSRRMRTDVLISKANNHLQASLRALKGNRNITIHWIKFYGPVCIFVPGPEISLDGPDCGIANVTTSTQLKSKIKQYFCGHAAPIISVSSEASQQVIMIPLEKFFFYL